MSGQDCAVCKLIRTYLLFAVPLLALVGLRTTPGVEKTRLWFARAELIDVLSWGCLAALIVIVIFKAYREYYLPARRARLLEEAKSRTMVEELD